MNNSDRCPVCGSEPKATGFTIASFSCGYAFRKKDGSLAMKCRDAQDVAIKQKKEIVKLKGFINELVGFVDKKMKQEAK